MTDSVPRIGDQIYKATYFDEYDVEIKNSPRLVYSTFEEGVERELHFMEHKKKIGAASYAVRLLRPNEVKRLVRERQREDFWHEVSSTALSVIGLENILPVIRLSEISHMQHLTPEGEI